MERVRLGVIGCGVIGPTHVKSAAGYDRIEVLAVADRIAERRERIAGEYGVPRAYAEGSELLADPDIDAVVLAVPAADRAALQFAALRQGKHLLLEKPVAVNAATVEQLMAARGDRVVGACSCRFQFLSATQAARDFIASGALGQLRRVHARNVNPAGPAPAAPPPEWRLRTDRNGGGILMNWGCYDLDYLFTLLDWQLRPRTVLAQTWPVPPQLEPNVAPNSDAETHFAAAITCEDGIYMTFERGEYMPARKETAWQISGTLGTLQLQMLPSETVQLLFDEAHATTGCASRVVWEGSDAGDIILNAPVRDFADAILDGREPATNLERSLQLMRLTDAIYASAACHAPVTVTDGCTEGV
jgi:predicted dehydrogenase